MAFNPRAQVISQNDVGTKYHLGIGTTSSGLSAPDRVYGYMLVAKDKLPAIAVGSGTMGHFEESTDLQTRDKIVQSFSPNLVDRDMVNFPRVSDGDFSGGGLQTVFIDPKRYWDSDLDTSTPGYLKIGPLWNTNTYSSLASPVAPKVVAYKGDFWVTFGEGAKVFRRVNAANTVATAILAKYVCTDNEVVYYSDGSTLYQNDGTTETQIAAAVNGTITNIWVVFNATNGYFLYYKNTAGSLYKVDLTAAFPVAAGSQPQVPTGEGGLNVGPTIIDLIPYQVGIAILTGDLDNENLAVWYHDGQNMTPIIRVSGYKGQGICNCLGDLYVSASPRSSSTAPILAKIGQGAFSIVARFGSPLPLQSQGVLQPVASAERVYVPVVTGSISGISGSNYIYIYNALTGAVSHFPAAQSGTDFVGTTDQGGNAMSVLGQNAGFGSLSGTTGYFSWQSDSFGTIKYMASGWLCSSRIDFNTPGIQKLLKRVIVNHAPLLAGQQILCQAWVDKSPTDFATTAAQGSAYNQYDAQVTDTTVGATRTVLQLPAATVGSTMFFALQLTSGASNTTTPIAYSVSIEVGVPWIWRAVVDCTSNRTCLDGQPDVQGLRGIDMYGLLHDAWENSNTVTFYHPNQNSYTAVIESLRFLGESPSYRDTDRSVADYEGACEVVLRQSAV